MRSFETFQTWFSLRTDLITIKAEKYPVGRCFVRLVVWFVCPVWLARQIDPTDCSVYGHERFAVEIAVDHNRRSLRVCNSMIIIPSDMVGKFVIRTMPVHWILLSLTYRHYSRLIKIRVFRTVVADETITKPRVFQNDSRSCRNDTFLNMFVSDRQLWIYFPRELLTKSIFCRHPCISLVYPCEKLRK